MLGHDRGHIIEPEFARHTTHRFESVDVTPGERLECLAMSKFQIHLPAVTFDQAEGV